MLFQVRDQLKGEFGSAVEDHKDLIKTIASAEAERMAQTKAKSS